MAEKITFLSEEYEIEGLLNQRDEKKGVVVTHPHPLYGGDMNNLVVESIVHVYHMKGYSTLKFNFRGVGRSQGAYDNGLGEQKDVLSALSFLADMGMERIDLAGYSFGAWVNAHALQKDTLTKQMIMVSPPEMANRLCPTKRVWRNDSNTTAWFNFSRICSFSSREKFGWFRVDSIRCCSHFSLSG